MAADTTLSIENVYAGYGSFDILNGVDLKIGPGEFIALMGPNGAGKSTLLKTIFGMTTFKSGVIRWKGTDIGGAKPRLVLSQGIGIVPQGRCNFPLMTVRENLELGAYTLRGPATGQAIDKVLTRFPLLAAKLGVLAGNLSGGEQQILETAMVLEAGPKLLLLDEPSLGLSPGNQDQIFEMIAQLRDGGLTVLVGEQNAHGALQISDTGIVMELGRLFMMGPAAEIASDPRIKIAYLGGQ